MSMYCNQIQYRHLLGYGDGADYTIPGGFKTIAFIHVYFNQLGRLLIVIINHNNIYPDNHVSDHNIVV